MISSRPDDRQYRGPAPRPSSRSRQPAWRILAVIILIIAGILGILAIFFPGKFKHELDISIFRQPTPYTQLFFADPAGLPGKLEVGHTDKFSFTIINDQGHLVNYHYVVTMTGGKAQKTVDEGSLSLADGQSATRTVGVVPTARATQYLIKVTLSGNTNFIQFRAATPK